MALSDRWREKHDLLVQLGMLFGLLLRYAIAAFPLLLAAALIVSPAIASDLEFEGMPLLKLEVLEGVAGGGQLYSPREPFRSYATPEVFDRPWYVSGDRRYASAQRSEQNHGSVSAVLRYASKGACILQTGHIQAGSDAGANSME
jgi:hypothetical protein